MDLLAPMMGDPLFSDILLVDQSTTPLLTEQTGHATALTIARSCYSCRHNRAAHQRFMVVRAVKDPMAMFRTLAWGLRQRSRARGYASGEDLQLLTGDSLS